MLEISSLDENFRNEIISQETIPYFQICEPHLDPYLLPLKNLDQFGLYKYFEEKENFFEKEFPVLKKTVFERIENLLDSFPIVVFLTGTPNKPYCQFSKQFLELIRPLKIRYMSFDIIVHDDLRIFLKLFSGWQTYPQIYIKGKIIGGVDILRGLIQRNELENIIPNECKYEAVLNYFKNIINNELVLIGKVN